MILVLCLILVLGDPRNDVMQNVVRTHGAAGHGPCGFVCVRHLRAWLHRHIRIQRREHHRAAHDDRIVHDVRAGDLGGERRPTRVPLPPRYAAVDPLRHLHIVSHVAASRLRHPHLCNRLPARRADCALALGLGRHVGWRALRFSHAEHRFPNMCVDSRSPIADARARRASRAISNNSDRS